MSRLVAPTARLRARVPRGFLTEALLGLSLGANLLLLWASRVDPLGKADLPAFVMAARALAAGRDPYLLHPDLLPEGWVPLLNLNAPLSLLAFAPLAHVDPLLALRVGQGVSLVLWAWLVFRVAPPHRRLWALACAGLWNTLLVGQVYVALALLVAFVLTRLRRGDEVGAGLALGLLLAFKPNFAVWPALALIAGSWRFALASLASAAAFGALPALVLGPGIYEAWLRGLAFVADPETTNAVRPMNVSLAGLAGRAGHLWAAGPLGIVLLGLIAAWTRRARPRAGRLAAVALATTLLASPVAWVGYTLLLLPALLDRPWGPATRLGALLLALPLAAVAWLPSSWPGFANLYALAVLALLAGSLLPEPPGPESGAAGPPPDRPRARPPG